MAEIYINIGNHDARALRLKFKDGARRVPAIIVSQAGGAQKLQEHAAAFLEVTYAEFVQAVTEERVSTEVRRYQAQLIQQSLSGGRRW